MALPPDSSGKPPKPAAKPQAVGPPGVKPAAAASPPKPPASAISASVSAPQQPHHPPAPKTPVLLRRGPPRSSPPAPPPREAAPSVVRPISSAPGPRSAGAAAGAAQGAQLDALLAAMETKDYFEILKVDKTATPSDIKRAFYRGSRAYHPDRYYQLADAQLKEKI